MKGAKAERLYFEEVQHFSLWIKGIALLPCVVLGCLLVLLWVEGLAFSPGALVLGALVILLILLAIPNFILRLASTLDSSHLHLKILPSELPVPFLPPRTKSVLLDDISHWEVRIYKPLLDREYWGTHFWSLGSAFGGRRHLYLMKVNPVYGRGVQLQLKSGERLLVGSERPEELAGAIARARGEKG
jgi:hypothetical protein